MAKFKPAKSPKDSGPKAKKIGNRWAFPAMMASAVIGLVWIVVFYVVQGQSNVHVPVITPLGNWNLIIGMSFIVASFGFAMKWE